MNAKNIAKRLPTKFRLLPAVNLPSVSLQAGVSAPATKVREAIPRSDPTHRSPSLKALNFWAPRAKEKGTPRLFQIADNTGCGCQLEIGATIPPAPPDVESGCSGRLHHVPLLAPQPVPSSTALPPSSEVSQPAGRLLHLLLLISLLKLRLLLRSLLKRQWEYQAPAPPLPGHPPRQHQQPPPQPLALLPPAAPLEAPAPHLCPLMLAPSRPALHLCPAALMWPREAWQGRHHWLRWVAPGTRQTPSWSSP